MSDWIDLRSDTVTRPTPAMREAMAKAPVGDDVFGEDPTVNALQEKAADLLGREAALFVPSGTMANQLAIKLLTHLGDSILIDADSHPFNYESGAAAVVSGVQINTLPGRRGLLSPAQIAPAVRRDNVHYAPTAAVFLENSHNRGGGAVYPIDTIAAIRTEADSFGLAMHLDGARLFNACAATGVKPADYAQFFDTVSFCLSKGLGAPVGSMLAGDRDRIAQAVRWRKMLGGGMRQVGILAAAGIYALDHHVERLVEDHENARFLARQLAQMNGIEIDPTEVETNIVIFRITRPGLTPEALCDRLKSRGLLLIPFGSDRVRAVTHLDVHRADIERATEIMASALRT